MDKNILKKFAIESRKLLEEKVADRINLYYVDEDFNEDKSGEVITLTNEKHNLTLTSEEYGYRENLLNRIKKYDGEYGDGLSHVIEEAAFTWFNRLVCLRYMELHDFLPLTKEKESLNIRVLSSRENEAEPEIMKNVNLHNPELDIKVSFEKLDKITNINDRYEYVLLKVCEKMGEVLPQIFDGETDYIELLIPKNLLNVDSFLDKLIKEVPEDNFNDIEIIGWFYQYYNQSEKDKAMKEKGPYKKSEIPYVTQIFTPDWIVKYMVENSLGRLWVEKNGDEEIIEEFKYFIKDNIEIDNEGILPENISFIDPCMGSGHILVYAFEVFMKLYLSAGYNKKDIPELILKNNLYGLDIDDRAGQFAIISVMLKAREYDKDIFNKIEFNKLNILSIQETNADILQWTISIRDNDLRETIEYLVETFKNAKEIGSLLIVEDKDYKKVEEYLNTINWTSPLTEQLIKKQLTDVVRVAKILSKKYDVVVTNPPYMKQDNYTSVLEKLILSKYKDGRYDLYSAFMLNLYKERLDFNGYLGMVTMNYFMYTDSFTELRNDIVNWGWESLLNLGTRGFDEMSGNVVKTVSFTLSKKNKKYNCIAFSLVDGKNEKDKEKMFLNNNSNKKYYVFDKNKINYIPRKEFQFTISNTILEYYKKGKLLEKILKDSKAGIVTGNDDYFVRIWHEVNYKDIEFSSKGKEINQLKYVCMSKGGAFNKWYGNNHFLMRLSDLYDDNKTNVSVRRGDKEFYFKKAIVWSQLADGIDKQCSILENSVCGTSSPTLYLNNDADLKYVLAFLNTKIPSIVFKSENLELGIGKGEVVKLPFEIDEKNRERIEKIVDENISIVKEWYFRGEDGAFEISWDFKKHPLA